jgi:hypothetical protein
MGTIASLNLALFIDRQDNGVCGRIGIKPRPHRAIYRRTSDHSRAQTGEPDAAGVRGRSNVLTELTPMPIASAIMAPIQRVASAGQRQATTRSATSALSGSIREGPVLSCKSPSKPSSMLPRRGPLQRPQPRSSDLAARHLGHHGIANAGACFPGLTRRRCCREI